MTQALRVLIVEDSPTQAAEVAAQLVGFPDGPLVVLAAGSLAAARALLGQQKADVVLLDLCLPDSAGSDTAVVACREFPELPVIVLTQTDDEETAAACISVGVQDYLLKGHYDARALWKALRTARARHQAWVAFAPARALAEAVAGNLEALRCKLGKGTP